MFEGQGVEADRHGRRQRADIQPGGTLPPGDGATEVFPPEPGGLHAVSEFTGHAVVLTDRDHDELLVRGADGFGGVSQPALVRWLAGADGTIGSHDVVLVARGRTGIESPLPERADLADHRRVRRALRYRPDARV